ncbi:hypothetical protein TCDM_12739 [Trypanosoma cruzi Dm28c]|uniref:Uncharacterized protein n=1 Tax=Trypanosoma cruzi Dm28c TaxID=1416333 RepID=V5CK73_TRYCR|nr:hypothetical protein TCDM_12739 [Trypanosoma cruzi Dm28c]
MRVALQRRSGVMPRGEYRCRPAHRLQEELLLPLSREEKRPQQPSDERSPAPPRGTCKLCRQKDADDALLHALRPSHPSQWQSHPVAPHAAVDVHSLRLLPAFPLPENSSVDVAHPPTCQKSLVFLLLLQIAQQHRQTHATPSFADSPQTRLPPHASAHKHTVRKHHAAVPHDGAAHANTAPRHSAQAVSGHTEQVVPVNNSPRQAVRQDSSLTIKQPALRLLLPPCTRFRLPHTSSVTPGPSISRQNAMVPSTQQEAH